MELRLACREDVPAVARLYDMARASLKAADVPQWQEGYPNGDDALRDIEQGHGYVLTEDGEVAAFACLAFGVEPTYNVIERGGWLGRGEYGFLHRVPWTRYFVAGARRGCSSTSSSARPESGA